MFVSVSRLLQTAQGSLLDDEQLVNTLNSSKTTSQEVTEQLQVSEQTEMKIDTAREVSLYFRLSRELCQCVGVVDTIVGGYRGRT